MTDDAGNVRLEGAFNREDSPQVPVSRRLLQVAFIIALIAVATPPTIILYFCSHSYNFARFHRGSDRHVFVE
jgi:hypothetical protein